MIAVDLDDLLQVAAMLWLGVTLSPVGLLAHALIQRWGLRH